MTLNHKLSYVGTRKGVYIGASLLEHVSAGKNIATKPTNQTTASEKREDEYEETRLAHRWWQTLVSWGRREDRKLYCPMSPVLFPSLADRSSTTRSMAAVPKPPLRQKGPVSNR